MASIEIKRHIDAPPERVFAMASDFAGAAANIEAILRVEMLTGGPVRVGTRFRETRKMLGRESTEEMEVTVFDPPRGYTLGCESNGCRYSTELRLEPSGSGTALQMVFEATPLTGVAKVMGFLMRPMMKKAMTEFARDLDQMKARLEAAERPVPAEKGAESTAEDATGDAEVEAETSPQG
ncbi:MAG: SRPBCC family protein [Planctomycetota bacterium]